MREIIIMIPVLVVVGGLGVTLKQVFDKEIENNK